MDFILPKDAHHRLLHLGEVEFIVFLAARSTVVRRSNKLVSHKCIGLVDNRFSPSPFTILCLRLLMRLPNRPTAGVLIGSVSACCCYEGSGGLLRFFFSFSHTDR